MVIQLFTDGACKGNPGPGGYGAILICGEHYKELSEGYERTTNNRMELMAVISGLSKINNPQQHDVLVYSDSKYVTDTINKKWIEKWESRNFDGVKNNDLWIQFNSIIKKFNDIKFNWIKGHNGHVENEKCDELAQAAAQEKELKIDYGYMP
jgi:ribonuclease HI